MTHSLKIPENIVRSIELQTIILKRAELGWNPVLKLINKGFVILKHTPFSDKLGITFEIVKSIENFYSENEQVFTWTYSVTMSDNNIIYVYNNPINYYNSYDFRFDFME